MTIFLPQGTDPTAAAAAMSAAGRRTLLVPSATSLIETFNAFAAALDFPSYFGKNLDALYDCLRDLPDHVTVIWVANSLRETDSAGYRAVLAVLSDLASARPDVRTVVIR